MNYLKKFESFQTHDEIHEICREYYITNYTINEDSSIDVNGDVDLTSKKLEKLPIKFNHVSGLFDCSENNLTTLEGAPQYVGGNFYCYKNKLTTLKNGSQFIGGDFWCSYNLLTTLEGAPQSVNNRFECSNNLLTTLEGAPQSVGGHFDCSYNNLSTLQYSPKSVNGNFCCDANYRLTTLEGAPQSVGGIFSCNDNKNLKSLNYLSIHIATDEVYFDNTPVYEIFKLLDNFSLGAIRLVNDVKVIVDDKIDIEKLNDLLYDQGKPPVENLKGYSNI